MISISLLVILYQTTCFFSWISRLFHDTFLLQAHMQIHLWLFIPTSIISCKYLLYFNKFFSRLLFSCLDFFNQVFQNIFDYWKCKKTNVKYNPRWRFASLSHSTHKLRRKTDAHALSPSLIHFIFGYLYCTCWWIRFAAAAFQGFLSVLINSWRFAVYVYTQHTHSQFIYSRYFQLFFSFFLAYTITI